MARPMEILRVCHLVACGYIDTDVGSHTRDYLVCYSYKPN